MVGDWKASIYSTGGHRYDYHLFLDHNGRYERVVRGDPDNERRDSGHWGIEGEVGGQVITLDSDTPDELGRTTVRWRVLAVTTCEDSNVLLVLREIILASRNLPILFYRVHDGGRGYGTGWQIDSVADQHGIGRDAFGAYLEECKAKGDGGTANERGDFTWQELQERAAEFKTQ